MVRRIAAFVTVFWTVIGTMGAGPSVAAEEFYKDKTIRMVVGAGAGGGYDTYTRAIARHMGKYIPGKPTIIVENMAGGGGRISANYMFSVAKPDGLTVGHFPGGLLIGQTLGVKGLDFEGERFEFIGAPEVPHNACALTRASGITSYEQWAAAKTPVKIGGTAPMVSAPDNAVRILKVALGLPIQLVAGYRGTADIRLAADSGEIAGSCWNYASIKATWRQALEAGKVGFVLQAGPKKHPELPDVPLAIDLAKTQEARMLIDLGIHRDALMGRPYVLPPGTPKDRVQALRRALEETLKDAEFLAEAAKLRLEVQFVSGDELKRLVSEFRALDPSVLAKLKEALLY